nr:hypothetical protein [Elizabethkingia sp. ASV34]
MADFAYFTSLGAFVRSGGFLNDLSAKSSVNSDSMSKVLSSESNEGKSEREVPANKNISSEVENHMERLESIDNQFFKESDENTKTTSSDTKDSAGGSKIIDARSINY